MTHEEREAAPERVSALIFNMSFQSVTTTINQSSSSKQNETSASRVGGTAVPIAVTSADATPCNLVDSYRCFEGTYCLQLQDRGMKGTKGGTALFMMVACFFLHSDIEDGDSKFLRNVDKMANKLYVIMSLRTVFLVIIMCSFSTL
jgi:hypothetical protein